MGTTTERASCRKRGKIAKVVLRHPGRGVAVLHPQHRQLLATSHHPTILQRGQEQPTCSGFSPGSLYRAGQPW